MVTPRSTTLLNGLIGAVVTVLLSFTVISPIVGGAVAGYLESTDGAQVGAISGAFSVVPVFLLGVLGLYRYATASLPVAFGVMVLFLFAFLVVWTIGLSTVGGYLGVQLRHEFQ